MLDGFHERLKPHLAPLPNFGERERAADAKRLSALEGLLGVVWCEECGTYHAASPADKDKTGILAVPNPDDPATPGPYYPPII